jgi:hypothetical protein
MASEPGGGRCGGRWLTGTGQLDRDRRLMHTSRELSSAAFQIRLDDRRASLGDVFAGCSEYDRAYAVNGRLSLGEAPARL